jgi:hypothetical protein
MMLGLKIGIGIVAGIVLINVAIWVGFILLYALITLAESLAKIWRRGTLK